jgi:hypothetical protein
VQAEVRYVTALYRALLGRDPEPAGLSGWVGALAAGATHLQIDEGIYNSPEHRGRQVDGFYATYLHRAAEPAGRAYWVNALLRGASETIVPVEFLLSPEYTLAHPDAGSFVRGLYGDVLGRAPDVGSELAWRQLVQLGGTPARALAALSFLNSQEEHLRLIDRTYADLLRRPADHLGRDSWLAILQTGGVSSEMLAQLFLSSDEFIGRAGVDLF